MTEREENVRKTDQIISRLLELWPVWAVLASGIVGGLNLYNTVRQLDDDAKAWKASSEKRRSENEQDKEAIRARLIKLEADVEWIRRGKLCRE